MDLDIWKDGCVVTFGCTRVFPWTTYHVRVFAPELVKRTDERCTISLLHRAGETDNVVFATADLYPDPLRRGLRHGDLVVGDSERAPLFDSLSNGVETFVVHVTLGDDNSTVVHRKIPLVMTPRVVQSGGGSSPSVSTASMWTVVDGGDVPADGVISLGDRTQTSFDATSAAGDVTVVPKVAGIAVSEGPFEAYARFSTSGSWSPMGDVFIGAEPVSWDYRDSSGVSSSVWVLHLFTIGGTWHASLKAEGVPPGVETDPDDDLVPGVEVNE